jgi:alanine-glyoxylate transaminase/serine-glyoxylate transaminase/serine-pyruvate transaminase
MSLGTGLGRLQGRVFRIGHLGHFNDVSMAGTIGAVQLGLELAGVPVDKGGIDAALSALGTP